MPVLEEIFLCALAAGLVLLHRMVRTAGGRDRQVHRLLFAGSITLAAAVVAQLILQLQISLSPKRVVDPILLALLFWLTVSCTVSLLMAVLARWTARVGRTGSVSNEGDSSVVLIRDVVQLVSVRSSVTDLTAALTSHLVRQLHLRRGEAFRCSPHAAAPEVTSICDPMPPDGNSGSRVTFADGWRQILTDSREPVPSALLRATVSARNLPEIVLPIKVGDRTVALVLLWQRANWPISERNRLDLLLIADVVGKYLEGQRWRRQEEQQRLMDAWLRRAPKIKAAAGLTESIGAVTDWLRETLALDFASLIISHFDHELQRWTVSNGRVLNQKHADTLAARAFFNYVGSRQDPVIVDDTSATTSVPVDPLMSGSDMRSILALALPGPTGPAAVLSLGSREPERYSASDTHRLMAAVPALYRMVMHEIQRCTNNRAAQRFDALSRFLANNQHTTSLQDLFDQAVRLIAGEVRCTMVRLSTFDASGAFLKSRSLSALRNVTGITPPQGTMILSLMPVHATLRRSGKTVHVKQDQIESKMPLSERKQVCCAGVQSALAVPIRMAGHVTAVLTLAEARSRARREYSAEEAAFVEAVAAGLSTALTMRWRSGKTRLSGEPGDPAVDPGRIDPARRGRLRSSLSSILGSIEMIRHHTQSPDTGMDKYLDIIDASAQRIHELFDERPVH